MKAADLKSKSDAELKKELTELRTEQFKLRIQYSLGQATRNHEFRRVRKDIARIKTVMNANVKAKG